MTNVFGFIAAVSALVALGMLIVDSYQRAGGRVPLLARMEKTKAGVLLMFAPIASFFLFFALTLVSAAVGDYK